jgi:hypothetical protein
MNTRQANEIDSYTTIMHAIYVVVLSNPHSFQNNNAFETFVEVFLNALAVSENFSNKNRIF